MVNQWIQRRDCTLHEFYDTFEHILLADISNISYATKSKIIRKINPLTPNHL
jgi:hypothetical protein